MLQMSNASKILIVGPSWVGDMMMSQSLYRTIKAQNPQAIIDVLAPAWCSALVNYMPEVNSMITMPIGHGKLALKARYQLGVTLREANYDQAIVTPNSLKSALVPFFAKIPKRTGWRGEMRYGLLNDIRTLNKAAFPRMVERYIALAYDKKTVRSAQDLPQPLLLPQLAVNYEAVIQTCQAFQIALTDKLIAFCPGAEFGPAKRWPDYHYATLAKKLIDDGYKILLVGSAKDAEITKDILSQLDITQQKRCFNLAGSTTLTQVTDLLSICVGVVTNDSGLMHVAAALGRPLVALYGPTSPDFTPPLSDKAAVIRLIEGYHKIRKGEAEQGYHQSLIDIQPEQAYEALLDRI